MNDYQRQIMRERFGGLVSPLFRSDAKGRREDRDKALWVFDNHIWPEGCGVDFDEANHRMAWAGDVVSRSGGHFGRVISTLRDLSKCPARKS